MYYVSQTRKLSINWYPSRNLAFYIIHKERQKPICRSFLLGTWNLNSMQVIIRSKKRIKITWLWDWHFYLLRLRIDKRIMFWILNNLSLTLRDTFERTPKVISNQNLFSRFQSWCWFWCWSWCLNFVYKNQTIWLTSNILGLQGFLLQPGWVSAPLISQKVTKSPPTQQIFTFTKFLHYYYLKLEIKE